MSREERVPAFIEVVTEIAAQAIISAVPLDRNEATMLAKRIALDICARYAKTEMYIPVAAALTHLAERNQRIWESYSRPGPTGARPFTGARIDDLAAEHNLTSRQIQTILADMRRLEAARRQQHLPGFDAAS